MRSPHVPSVTGVTSRIVSVNVGLPREVEWRGKLVRTGIFKRPATGPVRIGRLNLAGDGQADPAVHGGPNKAVYLYPSEHYAAWQELTGPLDWGAFGENLTAEGVAEADACIGDRWRAGTAELLVTQPRLPCFKLANRMGVPDFERRFLASGRTGFYFGVASEGEVAAGDPLTLVDRPADAVSVADVVRAYGAEHPDRATLERLVALPGLPDGMRRHFRRRLDNQAE